MPLTRKLTDLFVVGEPVTIDDGKGEPVDLYVRKISPLDAEEAFRKANEARAATLASKQNPEDPVFRVVLQRAEDSTKEEMVDLLVDADLTQRRPVVSAELEAEERWANDDYLQGLSDKWQSSLKEQHFTEPTDETNRVFAELEEFDAELEKRMEREKESIRKDLESLSHEKVKDRFFDAQFERQAEVAWLIEYRRQELFYAVRDPEDHDVKAFGEPSNVDRSSRELIRRLRDVYESISVDATEGKD